LPITFWSAIAIPIALKLPMAWDLCPQGVMDLQILDPKFSGKLAAP